MRIPKLKTILHRIRRMPLHPTPIAFFAPYQE